MDGGAPGEICTNRGRCEAECHTDLDCPAGAFCAESCGVCFTKTLRFASCFVSTLPRAEVLGACRGSDLAAGQARAAVSQVEAAEALCPYGRAGEPLPFPDGLFPPDMTDAVADAGLMDAAGPDGADTNDAAENDASADHDDTNASDASSDARDGESTDVDS